MLQPELPGLNGPAATHEERGLLLQGASGRLSALLLEQQRLLKRVALKRQDLEKLREELRQQGARIAAHVDPLAERLRCLDREVHALFGELLAERKLPRPAKREVRALYELLQDEGVLSPALHPTAGALPESDEPRQSPKAGAETAPAARPTDRGEHGGLRQMFLRMASALHPDKAQGADDLAARTEAMKELNRAYRERDLARLLEIQRSWSPSQVADVSPDDLERRCEALEHTNRSLRKQLEVLTREARELRKSDLGRLVDQRKRMRAGVDPLRSVVEEGQQEIERLTKVRDFVRSFRDGEISLGELLVGPQLEDDSSADAEAEFAEALAGLADLLADAQPRSSRGRGRQRQGRRRPRR